MLLALLLACGPAPGPAATGTDLTDFFPFDGASRTWAFADDAAPYRLTAEVLFDQATGAQGARVYPVTYRADCDGTPGCEDGAEVVRMDWESSRAGVFVHGFTVDGVQTVLDPPVQLASDDARRGDVLETTTADGTWSAAFVGMATCPVRLAVDWECAHIRVTTDAADGYPLAGDWWAAPQFNVVAFALDGDGDWELTDVACLEPGDCDGQW